MSTSFAQADRRSSRRFMHRESHRMLCRPSQTVCRAGFRGGFDGFWYQAEVTAGTSVPRTPGRCFRPDLHSWWRLQTAMDCARTLFDTQHGMV